MTRHPARLFATGLAAAAVTLVLLCLIPFNRYIQWQDLRVEAFARLGWIYERIHFDPTPIDVAFIGTSHTMNGIDGEAVAAVLAEAGQPAHVTNLAIPAYGRNLHWLIARELLAHRKVRTLVIEVFENETRRSHPAFVNVAGWRDVVGAPVLINLRWAADLALLPLNRAMLGAKSLLPAEFGLRAQFDPAAYDGPDPDNTRMVRVHGQAFTGPRDRAADPAWLDRVAREERAAKRFNMLPPALSALEYAVPREYLRQITDLAAQTGTTVVFLYLPGFGQEPAPHDMAPYVGYRMLALGDLLTPPAAWFDPAHLNAGGAAMVSRRVGSLLAADRS